MATWGIARRLFAVDVLVMAFVTALAAGTLAILPRVPAWPAVIAMCALVATGVPLAAWLRTHLDVAAVRVAHDWLPLIVIAFIYRAVVLVAGPSHGGHVVDWWLIAADRWIVGTDPTVRLHGVAFPALTESLQVAYALFFAFPILVGAELYARRADRPFREWMFVCTATFLLTYVGYLLLPAVGPGFTLHDASALHQDLPGLWLTDPLRAAIEAGGSVAAGVSNSAAMAGAARDAFPSGHAAVTTIAIWWCWMHRLRVRWVLTLAGGLVCAGAVYLRYHYLVDVLAGFAVAGICVVAAPAVHGWLAGQLGTLDERLHR
jgi:membrane-associated phospholipid phosphatase